MRLKLQKWNPAHAEQSALKFVDRIIQSSIAKRIKINYNIFSETCLTEKAFMFIVFQNKSGHLNAINKQNHDRICN